MKNFYIILLSIIAEINAIYLTKWAYLIQAKETNSFVCDINTQLSCSSVFTNDFAWFFWIPFSWIAIWAYWLIILITILWWKWKIRNHFKILFWLWVFWLLFNWYIIYHEFLANMWCILCLLCTAILAAITIIAFQKIKPKKPTQIISA